MPLPAAHLPPERDGWAAIWHQGQTLVAPVALDQRQPLPEMTLCLEFTLPVLRRRRISVRLWQGAARDGRAIAIYIMADGALRLVHDGCDLSTAPGFAQGGELITLRYRCCAKGRGDGVDIRNRDRGLRHRQRTGMARAACPDEAMPRDPRFLGICTVAAIARFGLAPCDIPALSAGAMVETVHGPRAVEHLQPGVTLVTTTGEAAPLRWIVARPRLCLGRDAPIRLHAPYFGLDADICVTPETRVLSQGPTVEYMFGEESVLVEAGHLTISRGARPARDRPVRLFYHLMLDDHACVRVNRCGVESALLADVLEAEDGASCDHDPCESDRARCLPVLDRSGAHALVTAASMSHGP